MTELRIINITQGNEFFDSSKSMNGGGYDQPTTEFEINGVRGFFYDESCGDFGTRYSLEFGNKICEWGSMLNESEIWSDFTGNEPYFEILKKNFGAFVLKGGN